MSQRNLIGRSSKSFAAERRFDAAIGISAVVTTTALVVLSFTLFGDAAERAQFVVAGLEGATLTLAVAIAGRALLDYLRRNGTVITQVPTAAAAAA